MEEINIIEEKQQQLEESQLSSEQESECEEIESNHMISYILIDDRPQKILTASYKRYTSIIEYEREFLNDLESAYLDSEDLEEIAQSRSGTVYKLEHDGKTLAMKLCHYFAVDRKGNRIVNELREEAQIYKILRDIKGPWPNLYFAGYIFNQNFYAIVTEFIDGRHPKKGDLTDFELCKGALEKLHDKGIVHGDPRPANFLISNNHARILDFGFSAFFGGDSTYYKDFNLMKRSFGI